MQVRGYELTRDLFHELSVVPDLANTCSGEWLVKCRDGELRARTLEWWRRLDSNQRPTDYETVALTT
jgi:hypothetical protein